MVIASSRISLPCRARPSARPRGRRPPGRGRRRTASRRRHRASAAPSRAGYRRSRRPASGRSFAPRRAHDRRPGARDPLGEKEGLQQPPVAIVEFAFARQKAVPEHAPRVERAPLHEVAVVRGEHGLMSSASSGGRCPPGKRPVVDVGLVARVGEARADRVAPEGSVDAPRTRAHPTRRAVDPSTRGRRLSARRHAAPIVGDAGSPVPRRRRLRGLPLRAARPGFRRLAFAVFRRRRRDQVVE